MMNKDYAWAAKTVECWELDDKEWVDELKRMGIRYRINEANYFHNLLKSGVLEWGDAYSRGKRAESFR